MPENATIVWAVILGYACLHPFWLLPARQQLANQLAYLCAKANHPTSCLLAKRKKPQCSFASSSCRIQHPVTSISVYLQVTRMGSTPGGVTAEVWTSQSPLREARRPAPTLPCHPTPVIGAHHTNTLISSLFCGSRQRRYQADGNSPALMLSEDV